MVELPTCDFPQRKSSSIPVSQRAFKQGKTMPCGTSSTQYKLQQAEICGALEGSKPDVPGCLPVFSGAHEKILYSMIVHFDDTSASGSMVLFSCNVWERSISGYWSMPIRNQCCDIITFLHLQSRWIINEQVAETPVSNRGNRYEGWAGGGGLKSLLCSPIISI